MRGEERRRAMEELPTSIRSMRLHAYCEQRAEAYWKAIETDSGLDWLKYQEITNKFNHFVQRRRGLPRKKVQNG